MNTDNYLYGYLNPHKQISKKNKKLRIRIISICNHINDKSYRICICIRKLSVFEYPNPQKIWICIWIRIDNIWSIFTLVCCHASEVGWMTVKYTRYFKLFVLFYSLFEHNNNIGHIKIWTSKLEVSCNLIFYSWENC